MSIQTVGQPLRKGPAAPEPSGLQPRVGPKAAQVQRILVVDDDRQIVRLASFYLEEAGFAVHAAYDGDAAVQSICRDHPDLIVLDVMLPGKDGMEIAHWLRADPDVAGIPILMLTARVEAADKVLGLELGADDYLTKPFNPRELVARVRAVLRRVGGGPPQPQILQVGGLRLDVDHHFISAEGRAVDLTPTEFALLQTLMESPDHAFTRTELIEKALGYTYEGMERTLDSHIKNLRRKIEADPAEPHYLETVFGVGYRLRRSGQ
jgi:two-component system, OmpR family, alkaline phosphatase synthesis response regulator PhoP